jgi:hypothetical protein
MTKRHRWLLKGFAFTGLLTMAVSTPMDGLAQAIATASMAGTSISVGATYSTYQADYGKRYLGGYAIHAEWDKTDHLGLQFEARVLRYNEEVGTHQTTFLIGPKFTLRRPWFNPYAKFLVGEGKFHFPYNYAEGTYFVMAPGAGIDVPLGQTRYTIRLIDFEYQHWAGCIRLDLAVEFQYASFDLKPRTSQTTVCPPGEENLG